VIEKRLIVCGDLDWPDAPRIRSSLRRAMAQLWSAIEPAQFAHVVVVHPAMKGASTIAGIAAARLGCRVEEHAYDWEKHGSNAPHQGHVDIAAKGAALCLSFWDGKHGDTLDMIREATKAGIPVRIIPWILRAEGGA